MDFKDPISQDAIDAAKSAHGEDCVAVINAPRFSILVRSPKRAEFKRWVDESRGGKLSAANEALLRSVMIVPEKGDHERFLDRFPAAPVECLDAVLELAGLTRSAEVAK